MSVTPAKRSAKKTTRTRTTSRSSNSEEVALVAVEDSDDENEAAKIRQRRRSIRKRTSPKKYNEDYVLIDDKRRKRSTRMLEETDEEQEEDGESYAPPSPTIRPNIADIQVLQVDEDIAGKNMYGFHTPKKRNGMALAAWNTPKTPKTPKTTHTPKTPKSSRPLKTQLQTKTPDTKHRRATVDPKTPSHVRHRVKNQIAQLMDSDSDFSASGSDFQPSDSSSSESSSSSDDDDDTAGDAGDDEPKTPHKGRRPIVVPVLPKTPSAARARQSARHKSKSSVDYVPESDGYFQAHASTKILTSDHTLDRLKNPRLPADRLFSLLNEMKPTAEHEDAISAMMEEYRSYFAKWLCILHEGFSLLLYGLGSKRLLLQSFHREVLAEQTVLVVNGFFPSLTLKDILDSIVGEILDGGGTVSPSNPHEAVDLIEEELSYTPQTHLYLIVHNLDGAMLRNTKAQAIFARLANLSQVHLLASIDYINTPLLWDRTRLSNFNFSWWDCTTMLPYSDETAFENSLLVQNSGELALSSMRSVFSSLTTNTRGIYMIIVKNQLKNKGNPNFQGMSFKDLYWSCREAFLVSSDLALRAQLTEFLDHKLVKSKRNIDGSELLSIPIDAVLLQQFLEEQEKKT
ncbi:origin recognition complex subunit 2 [Eurosta solidaginis]|uniref:origin recognition complex subunit 2 n=1 Tax=Eurosta solidaginis TaxID=178769 RepID=UPI00353096CB